MSESKYLKVQCACGKEQNLFSHVTQTITCAECKEAIAHSAGGKAIIHAKILEELG